MSSIKVQAPKDYRSATAAGVSAQPARNRILDFVRIGLAMLVLLAHAPELMDGNRSHELLIRYAHAEITFGDLGVDFFFVLSGYLITRSWVLDPRLGDYLKKRLLRIVPGYVVAFLASIVICGLVAPSRPRLEWFRELFCRPTIVHCAVNFLTLSVPRTPPVFPGQEYDAVNNSLWTLAFEFRCYLLVALFGLLGLFRRRAAWLISTLVLGLAFPEAAWIGAHASKHYNALTWGVSDDIRLFFAFFVGGCFFIYKKHLPFRSSVAAGAALLLTVSLFTHFQFHLVLIVTGAYLLFTLERVHLPNTGWYAKMPDISYGMYVYGWPVQQLCIWLFHPSTWILFLLSTLISMVMGMLSWHFVERPMLALKPRSSASLPQTA